MISLFEWIPGKTSAGMHISTLEFPPYLVFILLYLSKLMWMSPFYIPNTIAMSPYNTPMCHNLFWVGKSAHVPGHLSVGHCSEQNTKVDVLLVPFAKGEMATPGVYCDIYTSPLMSLCCNSSCFHSFIKGKATFYKLVKILT